MSACGGARRRNRTRSRIWAYRDANDRFATCAKVAADPAWQGFLAEAGGCLEDMQSIFLLPTNYSPMK